MVPREQGRPARATSRSQTQKAPTNVRGLTPPDALTKHPGPLAAPGSLNVGDAVHTSVPSGTNTRRQTHPPPSPALTLLHHVSSRRGRTTPPAMGLNRMDPIHRQPEPRIPIDETRKGNHQLTKRAARLRPCPGNPQARSLEASDLSKINQPKNPYHPRSAVARTRVTPDGGWA